MENNENIKTILDYGVEIKKIMRFSFIVRPKYFRLIMFLKGNNIGIRKSSRNIRVLSIEDHALEKTG